MRTSWDLLDSRHPGVRAQAMTVTRAFRWILLIAVMLGGGYLGWRLLHVEDRGAPARSAKADTAVPVTVATVTTADLPVYLQGLGTVQGFNTVVVRTRVDGQIDTIAFKEGQLVEQGDLIAQIDPRPFQAALDQAKAKKDQDQAALANARLDLQRYTDLGQFATRQQLDTQRATVRQDTAQIEADDAAIANARTQLDYTTIRAPIAGVTGFRQVDQGNIVNAATQTGIVTIAQIEPIAVIFTAPEERLPDIKAAMASHTCKVTALSTDGRKTLSEGTLALINNQVDTTSGTIRLKAVFDNADHALWPGQAISTRLLLDTARDAVVVPDDAVQRGANGLYAYVVGADNKAELRPITIGPSTDGRTIVEKGLTAGQSVIVSGQYRVQPGTSLATRIAASS
jgi:multidrug efflux system membrane fusion protein